MNTEKIRVLLVEDNPTDALIVEDELTHTAGARFSVVHIEQLDEALTRLATQPFDVVLLDLSLPDSHGLETFVRLHKAVAGVPIVVLSGRAEEELAVQAVQAGAQDYLVKGHMGEDVLGRSIRYAIERSRAERTLAESEERYRLLIEQSPDGYLVHCNGRIVFANATSLKMLGAGSVEQLMGRSILDTVAPEYQDVVRQRMENAQTNRFNPPMEILCVRLDDTTVAVEATSHPFTHEGQPAVQVVMHDITERKRAEARLRRLLDSNAQGVMFWNTKGEATGANDAFLELVGYSREDLEAGRVSWVAMTPPEYAELDRRGLEELAARGVCRPYEKEFIRKDGSRVPLILGAAVFEDNAEEGVCFTLDLSDRKRAEQQIVEQAALLDHAQDAIFVHDLQGCLSYWNKSAERVFGWTEDEAIGCNVQSLLYEKAGHYNATLEALLREGDWIGETSKVTKTGDEVLVEGRWTLLCGADGRAKSILVIDTDITETKKIEAQLFRAQRMDNIGTLAGGIAHDLNNVLGPMIMAVDLLRDKAAPGDLHLLDIMEASGRRGAAMVKQVLFFARGIEGERTLVSPVQLVNELQMMMRDTFPKAIRLEIAAPGETWNTSADRTQLHQVLMNLCINARDAMPQGGKLSIAVKNHQIDEQYASMHADAHAGPYVVMEVADTGDGMPPEVLAKIFEPFFTTKEIGKGTGLGLSTTQAIIKSHGGFITVKSEPGKGTTFQVSLPAEIETEEVQIETKGGEPPHGDGELILLIEDEASICTITGQMLETFGYQVMSANDGAVGVAQYAQHSAEIAAVITDMQMPIMDGIAAIRVLVRINPEVKIIVASGSTTQGTEEAAITEGAKYFMPKPYTAETMLRTLHKLLHGEAPPAEKGAATSAPAA